MSNYVIHIGFPKNMSTSLQRNFFSKHDELFHLGVGVNDYNLGYVDSNISSLTEVFLKYSNSFHFEKHKIKLKEHLQKIYNREKNNYKYLSLSSEHLSFKFSNDVIDFCEKIKRIRYIFEDDVKFIIIIRNQNDLIKSLFGEMIRVGSFLNFDDYTRDLYLYRYKNFIYEFHYDKIYESLIKYFKKQNIFWIIYEDYFDKNLQLKICENQRPKIYKDICKFLNINFPLNSINRHHNKSLSKIELEHKRKLNFKSRHDFGNHINSSVEFHRLDEYYNEYCQDKLSEDFLYKDVRTKRLLIKSSQNGLKSRSEISYKVSHDYWKKLLINFEKSNKIFEKKNKIKASKSIF